MKGLRFQFVILDELADFNPSEDYPSQPDLPAAIDPRTLPARPDPYFPEGW